MLKSIYNWVIGAFAIFWIVFIFIDYWQSHQIAYTQSFDFFQFKSLTFSLLLLGGLITGGLLWVKNKKKSLPIINGLGIILICLVFILMTSTSVLSLANVQPAVDASGYMKLIARIVFVAFSLVLFLIIPAYCLGGLVTDRLNSPLPEKELSTINIALGIVVIVTIVFILGIFNLLTPFIIYPILVLILGLFWRRTLFFLKSNLVKKIELDESLNAIGIISFLMTLFFVSINFVQIIRPYPFGFDALSLYVNLPSLLHDYGGLVKGYQPYNWSLWMSLGYILFGKTEFVLALSFSGGVLSLIVLYQIARRWLDVNFALLTVVLFYSLPSINFQSYKDMKIDLGVLYITLCIVLLLINWLTQKFSTPIESDLTDKNSFFSFLKKHQLVVLMGILSGFGLGMKFTMLFAIISLISIFWYVYSGKLAFVGAFCLGMAGILILKIDDMSGARDYHLFADSLQWILLLAGVILIGVAFFRNGGGVMKSLKLSLLYGVLLLLIFIPWPIKNIVESEQVNARTILFGAPTGPQLTLPILESNYEKSKN